MNFFVSYILPRVGYGLNDTNITDELVSHPALGTYKLRVTEPELCDPSVKQYSGYLDIEEDKHLFFWYVITVRTRSIRLMRMFLFKVLRVEKLTGECPASSMAQRRTWVQLIYRVIVRTWAMQSR